MRQLASLAAVLLLTLGTGGPVLAAQARERALFVSLVDKDGRPVKDAVAADFIVTEDGVRREVLRVRPATEPMQIALLVDTSEASTPSMQDIRKGVSSFITSMAGKNDLAIITIGERPKIQADYTSNPVLLEKGVGRLFAASGSGAYLLEGIVEAANGLAKRDAARPVIIAIATEGTEYSNRHYNTVLKALQDAGAAFHALLIPPSSGDLASEEIRNRNVILDRGTSETGGRRETLLSSMSIDEKLRQVAADLNAQYLVTYGRPQALLQPERIQVKAANGDLTARGTPVRVPRPPRGK